MSVGDAYGICDMNPFYFICSLHLSSRWFHSEKLIFLTFQSLFKEMGDIDIFKWPNAFGVCMCMF